MRSLNTLAIRNMQAARLRTTLSVVAVMLGVAMVIAANGMASAMRDALTGADEGRNIAAFAASLVSVMLNAVGVIVVLAAAFMIFNAFQMSITQRQKQIGVLRSLGMTRRQILRLVLTEAFFTGIIGTALGLLAGPLITESLILMFPVIGGVMFSAFGNPHYSVIVLLVAAGVGIGVSFLAVFVPAMLAMRVSPLVAIRREDAAIAPDTTYILWRAAVIIIVLLFGVTIINPPGDWLGTPQNAIATGLLSLVFLLCLLAILPAMVGGVSGYLHWRLLHRGMGRLVADNLARGRLRVVMTILTLAVGLTTVASLTGIMSFMFKDMLLTSLEDKQGRGIQMISSFDYAAGMSAYTGETEDLALDPEIIASVRAFEEADTGEIYIGFVPELVALFPDIMTYVLLPEDAFRVGDLLFTFNEGSWESARPLIEEGCTVFVVPMLAGDRRVGDSLMLSTLDGEQVPCRIGGIGGSVAGISLLVTDTPGSFGEPFPMMMLVEPHADTEAIAQELERMDEQRDDMWVLSLDEVLDIQVVAIDGLTASLNGVLLIVILTAALGIINTTVMSNNERQQELGMLRAVGATRRQIRGLVMGEAALMGLISGLLGLLAGVGLTVIFVTTYGSRGMGIDELNLRASALKNVLPVLLTGVVGLIAAPLISAGAAYLPTRRILADTPINNIMPREQ